MAIDKPYYLTVRQFDDGDYSEGARSQFILDQRYSLNAIDYIRAFLIIQKDLLHLFEYIEPGELNKRAYSIRTYELMLRTCTEIENNFKAILRANTYSRSDRNWNIRDYIKINQTHFLSQYEVKIPYWDSRQIIRKPFDDWNTSNNSPGWYKSYNHAKHNRTEKLHEANLNNLLDAFCGLAVLIAAQYYTYNFSSADDLLAIDSGSRFEAMPGDYVTIQFPQNVPAQDRYTFRWGQIANSPQPFEKFDYDSL